MVRGRLLGFSSVSWVDETGWHSKAVSSFPGAEIFGGGGGQGVGTIMQIIGGAGAAMRK